MKIPRAASRLATTAVILLAGLCAAYAQPAIIAADSGLSGDWSHYAWGGLKSTVVTEAGRQAVLIDVTPGKTRPWAGASLQPAWNQPQNHSLRLSPEDLAAGALGLAVNGRGAGGQQIQFAVTLADASGKEYDPKGFIPFDRVSDSSRIDADPATWQSIRIPLATVVARAGVSADQVAGIRKIAFQIVGDAPAAGFLVTDIALLPGDPARAAAAKQAASTVAALVNPRLEAGTDSPDWNHAVGRPLRFHVKLAADQPVAVPVEVSYRLGYEKFEGPAQTLLVPPDGAVIDFGSPDRPGFVRLRLVAAVAGKELKKTVTAAVSADQIRPSRDEPADFDAFWAATRAELARIPADPVLVPKPELSGPAFDAYELSLANLDPSGSAPRFYGVLCVPKGPGPFPAILQTPGAGVRGYKGEIWVPRDRFITLEVGIHGIPVTEPAEFYRQQAAGPLKDYQFRNLHDREIFYYRRVYAGVLRSLDYLASHEKWDGKNLVVRGGSQGGQLAIVAAALDPRVTAVAAAFPAWCDVAGHTVGRAGGWPGLFTQPPADNHEARALRAAQLETTGYYDTVNFARRLRVPVYLSWGYNDDVCPPTSFYALRSVITAPVELRVFKEAAHNLPGAGWGAYTNWTVARAGNPR